MKSTALAAIALFALAPASASAYEILLDWNTDDDLSTIRSEVIGPLQAPITIIVEFGPEDSTRTEIGFAIQWDCHGQPPDFPVPHGDVEWLEPMPVVPPFYDAHQMSCTGISCDCQAARHFDALVPEPITSGRWALTTLDFIQFPEYAGIVFRVNGADGPGSTMTFNEATGADPERVESTWESKSRLPLNLRRTTMRALRRSVLVPALLALLLPHPALPATWSVEADGTGDFLGLGAAVAVAAADDSILVGPGVYAEGAPVEVFLPLTIASTHGAQATVLDGAATHRILACGYPGTDVALRGFTFLHGRPSGTLPAAGALLVYRGATVDVRGCVFRGCEGESGGALYVTGSNEWPGTRLEARDCLFEENRGEVTGGAAYVVLGATALFRDCTFRANTTDVYAGAVQAHRATMDFRGCLFEGNRSGDVAGALYWGTFGQGSAVGCTFVDHTSPGNIAGTIVAGSYAQIRRCVFVGETDGYAVRAYAGQPDRSCNVYWNNAAGAVGADDLGPDELVADPLFCSLATGDYRLQWGSPCLPPNSGGCALIGTFGFGGCSSISVETESWGRLRARYRSPGD